MKKCTYNPDYYQQVEDISSILQGQQFNPLTLLKRNCIITEGATFCKASNVKAYGRVLPENFQHLVVCLEFSLSLFSFILSHPLNITVFIGV